MASSTADQPLSQSNSPHFRRVRLYGIDYQVDLDRCRQQQLSRVAELRAEGKQGSGLELIAEAAGVDRATVARLFSDKDLRVESFVDIVTRGLRLPIEEVLKAIEKAS